MSTQKERELARLEEMARDLPPEALSHLSALLALVAKGEQSPHVIRLANRLAELEGSVAAHYHPGMASALDSEDRQTVERLGEKIIGVGGLLALLTGRVEGLERTGVSEQIAALASRMADQHNALVNQRSELTEHEERLSALARTVKALKSGATEQLIGALDRRFAKPGDTKATKANEVQPEAEA